MRPEEELGIFEHLQQQHSVRWVAMHDAHQVEQTEIAAQEIQNQVASALMSAESSSA